MNSLDPRVEKSLRDVHKALASVGKGISNRCKNAAQTYLGHAKPHPDVAVGYPQGQQLAEQLRAEGARGLIYPSGAISRRHLYRGFSSTWVIGGNDLMILLDQSLQVLMSFPELK